MTQSQRVVTSRNRVRRMMDAGAIREPGPAIQATAKGGAMGGRIKPGSLGGRLVLGLRFVSEAALVAGAAWAVSTRPRSVALAVGLGIGAALVVAAVWSTTISSGSPRRLRDPLRLVVELALFAAVALGLAAVGHSVAAAAVLGLGAIPALAVRAIATAPPPGVEPGETRDGPAVRPTASMAPTGPTRSRPRYREARRRHRGMRISRRGKTSQT